MHFLHLVLLQSTVDWERKILFQNMTRDEKINELKSIAKETVDITGGFLVWFLQEKSDNEQKDTLSYLKIIFKSF